MKKLAIITTHPIQYNAPFFKVLAERKEIAIKVFYTWENSKEGIFDIKFNQPIKWDIPLLDGYDFQFVKNTSKDQGTHHNKGIINPMLNKEIENWGADAILVYGWNFQSHFRAMRHFKGRIPVYFRGDSTLLGEKKGIKTILRRIALTFVYRYIDYALYVGTNNKNYFLKHGLKEKQLLFAPHAVDNERFYDLEGAYSKKALQWRKELGFKESDIVFLFAGKFELVKNPELIVKAANNLINSNYKFILAGDGEMKEHLLFKSSDNPNIIFLPFQNQTKMPELYRVCNVFILSSYSETWGLSVNEAMACGKAILISDKVGCAPDLVENGKNGYIFKSDNLDDLITKIILFNTKNCINFGNHSLKIVEQQNFNTSAVLLEESILKN